MALIPIENYIQSASKAGAKLVVNNAEVEELWHNSEEAGAFVIELRAFPRPVTNDGGDEPADIDPEEKFAG